jgi:hypothetical protein
LTRIRQAVWQCTALLVVPFLLVTGLPAAWTTFVCDYDHVARPTCCCPAAKDRGAASPETAAIARASCCEVSSAQAADPEPRSGTGHGSECSMVAVVLATTVAVVPSLRHLPTRLPVSLERPPGPPLILIKHSFLI